MCTVRLRASAYPKDGLIRDALQPPHRRGKVNGTMVVCERCHRKFSSYAAVLQHYKTKHPNVANLSELENKVATEKETRSLYKASIRSRGPSRVKLMAFVFIVIVAFAAIGYVALTPREQTSKTVTAGMVAPDFSLPDTTGSTFRLSDYRGKSHVLLFFSEGLGCQPCLSQMRDLDELNGQFRDLNVLLVSVTGDPLSLLTDWARASGPRYGRVLSDSNLAVSKMYDMLGADVSMMPGTAPGHTFILVNRAGMIVWRHDYGPGNMYVPNNEIIMNVRRALGAS